METETRRRDGVTILGLKGKITIGAGDVVLREAVAGLLADGERQIVIDMAKVTRMDSSGLGELVAAQRAAGEAGATIRLLHVPANIGEVLQITQIVTVFDIFGDEDEAVRSFA